MKNNATVVVLVALVGLGVGFGGGYYFRDYKLTKARANFGAAGTAGAFQRFAGARGMGMRGGAVQGTILSMDASSITVKLADGSTKIVLLSDSTVFSNTAVAARGDLKTGTIVAVFGSPNSDGSVTATNVQLNPMNFRPQVSPSPSAQ